MGSLGETHRRGRIRPGRTNRDPLRKVIGRQLNDHGLVYEVLECGHTMLPRQDFIGPTNAGRRRCRKCGAETGRVGAYNKPDAVADLERLIMDGKARCQHCNASGCLLDARDNGTKVHCTKCGCTSKPKMALETSE